MTLLFAGAASGCGDLLVYHACEEERVVGEAASGQQV